MALPPPPRSPADATLALLWERMRRNGDMPGFTRSIRAILGAMRGEDEAGFNMTRTVLSDPVLTQKVLRLANSSMYSAFGQSINTVSKAVQVLGIDAIGHLALGLKLVEELGASGPTSASAHIEMEKAVLAGMVAKQVAAGAGTADPEEAVVCAMLHALGRMLLTFYLPERWGAMQEQAGQGAEESAAVAVLGLSVEQLGRAAAEHWGLPRNLLAGMRVLDPATLDSGELAHGDWLALVSTLATQCAAPLWADEPGAGEQVRKVAARYCGALGVGADDLVAAIGKARADASAALAIAPLARPAANRAAPAAAPMRAAGNTVLAAGVADMRGIRDSATPGRMMAMALETVFKGLSMTRAFAFLRHRAERTYSAKMGLGEGVNALLPLMNFSDQYQADVFHAALSSDRVIFVENAHDPRFGGKLPSWWKASLSDARAFVLVPVSANGQGAGFVYGDWDATFPNIVLSQAEFGLLNDLRALVVQAVERKAASALQQA